MRSLVVEVPDDGHIALLLSGNLEERLVGKVEVVLVAAGRAGVSDSDTDSLAVVGVCQRDLATTVGGLLREITVALRLCIDDHQRLQSSNANCHVRLTEGSNE